jgi:hypothetical protein
MTDPFKRFSGLKRVTLPASSRVGNESLADFISSRGLDYVLVPPGTMRTLRSRTPLGALVPCPPVALVSASDDDALGNFIVHRHSSAGGPFSAMTKVLERASRMRAGAP